MSKKLTTLLITIVGISGCDLLTGDSMMTEPPMMPTPLTLSGTDGNVTLDSAPCATTDYSYEVSGGTPPYAFALSAPSELNAMGTLGMTGNYEISVGVNGAIGSWALTVIVQDSAGASVEKMVVFANSTAFTVSASGDDLVNVGASTSVSAMTSIESMTVATDFAWTVQASPMGSSFTSGSMLMGSASSVDFTPDVSGAYELGVTATQGVCTATASFALSAREECTSSVTLFTMDGDIALGQRTIVAGQYDDPSGDETYEWRLTNPDGSQEDLTVETFENQSGMVIGANAYFTPANAGAYQLQFTVTDQDCQYTGTVNLQALPQAIVLSHPRSTYVISSYPSEAEIQNYGLQYGDGWGNIFGINGPDTFADQYGGLRTEVSLQVPEFAVELSIDCTDSEGLNCEWWDTAGMVQSLGDFSPSLPDFSGLLLLYGAGLRSNHPSPMSVPTIYIRDARPIPSIATATKTVHFRYNEEVPFAIYDGANNVFPGQEAVVSEGNAIRLEITAGYFNAPLTFVLESSNPLLTLSSTTVEFPAQSEGMSKSIMLTAAQDMDIIDNTAIISIRELNNGAEGTGWNRSYSEVSTQIHIQDDDRVDPCPMMTATSCFVGSMELGASSIWCLGGLGDISSALAVKVNGGSGNYQFYYHQRDSQRGGDAMFGTSIQGPPIPSYASSVKSVFFSSMEGDVSEWATCSSSAGSDSRRDCATDIVVVDQVSGCAVRHNETSFDIP